MLKKKIIFSAALSAALTCTVIAPGYAQTFPTLQKGPYSVGFTTSYQYDRSRPILFEQQSFPDDQKTGRPIQINIWYPSNETGGQLTLLDYFKLTTKEVDFKAEVESVTQIVEVVIQEQLNTHGIEINKAGLINYLSVKNLMQASRDLAPAKGSFPIIIIGPETAFKWCYFAEFLASHGYVVVATPKAGSSEKLPDFERTLFDKETFVRSAEASHSDLQYVTAYAKSRSFADKTKVGLFGYSSNISDGLGLITRGVSFDAIVSLEGSIGGYTGGEVLSMTPFYSPYAIKQPLLHIYSPAFGFNPYWIDQFKYCERTLIATYDIRHDHLTSLGILEEFIPNISGQTKSSPRIAIEVSYQYALNFFDAHLKKKASALAFISKELSANKIPATFQQGVDSRLIGIKSLPANKTYDEHELNSIYSTNGFDAIEKIYAELVINNSQPFSKSTFFNFGRFLKTSEEREVWYTHYREAYKDFSEPYFLLAQEKQRLKKSKEAIAYYEKAQELFQETDHILLEEIFERIIKRRLEPLKQDGN